MMKLARKRLDRGFTMVELLVVMLIMGMLVAIAVPIYINQRNVAEENSIRNALTSAAIVLQQEKTFNSGTYPPILPPSVNMPNGVTSSYTHTPDLAAYCLKASQSGITLYLRSRNPAVDSMSVPSYSISANNCTYTNSGPDKPSLTGSINNVNIPLLSWGTVSGASSYRIFKNGVQVGNATAPALSWSGDTLSQSADFSIFGVNNTGVVGPESNKITLSPVQSAPTVAPILTLTDVASSTMSTTGMLNWAAVQWANAYSVFDATTNVLISSGPSLSLAVSVGLGETKSFYVIASNSIGTSPQSNTVTLTGPSNDYPVINVTMSLVGPANAIATWPLLAGIHDYFVSYKIGTDDWVAPFSVSATTTSYTIYTPRLTQVSIRVWARYDAGGPHYGTATITGTEWAPLALQNGWSKYTSTLAVYSDPQYTRTSSGVIVLTGMIKGGTSSLIATLPIGYRPGGNIIFLTSTGFINTSRIDVLTDGSVIATTSDPSWLSLDGVQFLATPATTGLWKLPVYNWTPTVFQNGWTNYGSNGWSNVTSTVDSSGRVAYQGVAKPGIITDRTTITSIGASNSPDYYMHVLAMGNGPNRMGIDPVNSDLNAKGFNSSYYSMQTMFYPKNTASWNNLSLMNNWVRYGGASSTFTPPQYTIGADGMVTLRGFIAGGDITPGTIIGRLPPGSRPAQTVVATLARNSATAANGHIYIYPNGDIVARSVDAGWTSLDGINFMPDANQHLSIWSDIPTDKPDTVRYSWNGLLGTNTYEVQYMTPDGIWHVQSAGGWTGTTLDVVTGHGRTSFIKIRATNAQGTTDWVTYSATVPLWAPIVLQSGWRYYDGDGGIWAKPNFLKTSAGVVMLSGLITGGTYTNGTVIGQLPPGYRPTESLIFQQDGSPDQPNGTVRLDIFSTGQIVMANGGGATGSWISLDGLNFLSATAGYSWTNLSLTNGWTSYGAPWAVPRAATDSLGRTHIQGLVNSGTLGNGTPIGGIPAAMQPDAYMHIHAEAGDRANYISISSSVLSKVRTPAGWTSIQTMYQPASNASKWMPLALQNSWVVYPGYTPPQYTKSADGIVMVRGLIRNGVTAFNTVVATLPVGYRPALREVYTVVNADYTLRVDVLPTGEIVLRGSESQAISPAWLALESITFMAEPYNDISLSSTFVSKNSSGSTYSLSWAPVSGASSYNLYRGGTLLTSGVTSGVNVTNNWGYNSGSVIYTMKPVSSTGVEIAESSQVSISTVAPTPPTPPNLTLTLSGTTVTTNWGDTVDTSKYRVQYYYNGVAPITSIDIAYPTRTTTMSLPLGSTLSVYVYAIDYPGITNSAAAIASITSKPAAPTGLTINRIWSTQVTMSWNAVPGATSYELRGANATVATTGTSAVTTISADQSKNMTVVAINGGGASPSSSAVLVVMPTSGVGAGYSFTPGPPGSGGTSNGINNLNGTSLMSPSGRFLLYFQYDGNLVLYDLALDRATYTTNTGGYWWAHLGFQPDGNLVLYNSAYSAALAFTSSSGSGGFLQMQDDGNVVIYNGSWTPIYALSWGTGSSPGGAFLTHT